MASLRRDNSCRTVSTSVSVLPHTCRSCSTNDATLSVCWDPLCFFSLREGEARRGVSGTRRTSTMYTQIHMQTHTHIHTHTHTLPHRSVRAVRISLSLPERSSTSWSCVSSRNVWVCSMVSCGQKWADVRDVRDDSNNNSGSAYTHLQRLVQATLAGRVPQQLKKLVACKFELFVFAPIGALHPPRQFEGQ